MAEYIDRAAILKAYEEVQRGNGPWRFETLINSVPASDVAPVVHGRWAPYDNEQDKGFHYCSVCKSQAFNYGDGSEVVEVLSNFCHNCGSNMDKETTMEIECCCTEDISFRSIPASDVAPAAHGRWIDVGSLSCRCSNCGCKNSKETDYCPNCGAKMDEEDK